MPNCADKLKRSPRPRVTPPAGQADSRATDELVVEAGVGEVGIQQRLGDVPRQPDVVQREGLSAGHPEALEVHQLGVVG